MFKSLKPLFLSLIIGMGIATTFSVEAASLETVRELQQKCAKIMNKESIFYSIVSASGEDEDTQRLDKNGPVILGYYQLFTTVFSAENVGLVANEKFVEEVWQEIFNALKKFQSDIKGNPSTSKLLQAKKDLKAALEALLSKSVKRI